MQNGKSTEIDLDHILGIGGESLVIQRNHGQGKKAFKIIPLDGEKVETKNKVQKLQNRLFGKIGESVTFAPKVNFV